MESDELDLDIRKIIALLDPYFPNNDARSRMMANIFDIIKANEWLILELKNTNNLIKDEDVEDFLINLDIKYINHVMYHIKLLRNDVNSILRKIK